MRNCQTGHNFKGGEYLRKLGKELKRTNVQVLWLFLGKIPKLLTYDTLMVAMLTTLKNSRFGRYCTAGIRAWR